MKLNDSILAQIGRQTLLAGFTMATQIMVDELNGQRSQLNMPPQIFGETSIIDAEERPRLGRPPGSTNKQKQLESPSVKQTMMQERRELVRQAGLRVHGSPSEADAEKARKILQSGGGTKSGGGTRSGGGTNTTTVAKRRWALVRAAGMRLKGSPNELQAQKALTYLTRKGIPLPPEATMPISREPRKASGKPRTEAQKEHLRTVTLYRWSTVGEAGLKHLAKGRLPSNELLAKAERILKARKAGKRLRQGLSADLQQAVIEG